MQTDIYCIGRNSDVQFFIVFFLFFFPTESFATLPYCLRSLGVCCAVAVQAESPGTPFLKTDVRISSQDYLLVLLPISIRIPSFSDWTGMLLSHSGKILTWPSREPDSQSEKTKKNKNNKKTGKLYKRIVSQKFCQSYSLMSQSFWYKTRLLCSCYSFQNSLKTRRKKKSNIEYIDPYCKPQH